MTPVTARTWKTKEHSIQIWAPPDPCIPRCVFRDCPCTWQSPSLGTRGLADAQCICPFRPTDSLGRKGQIHCVSTRALVPREGLYQIHGQSLNTHRGKHGSGGAQQMLQYHDRKAFIGSAKTDPVRLKWGFGEGLLKDKFAFCEDSKNPIPKRRTLLAKRLFL